MKKSEITGLRPMTKEELSEVASEQKRYMPALSLIQPGTYHFETDADKNTVNIYPLPYVGNDGQPRSTQAVCLKENDELIPLSNLCTRSINVLGTIVVSKGFYETTEDISACKAVLDALDATKKGFVLTHKVGTWADNGRRRGTKPVVTPL